MPALVASQTGVAVIDGDGQILDAGWARGAGQAIGWADSAVGDGDTVLFADAPLVVRDVPGQRGLPDAGRAAVRPLEGQRQDECPFVPTGGRAVPAPGRTVRLAIVRPQPRRLWAAGQVCISTADAGTSPPATMGGDMRNLIVSSLEHVSAETSGSCLCQNDRGSAPCSRQMRTSDESNTLRNPAAVVLPSDR